MCGYEIAFTIPGIVGDDGQRRNLRGHTKQHQGTCGCCGSATTATKQNSSSMLLLLNKKQNSGSTNTAAAYSSTRQFVYSNIYHVSNYCITARCRGPEVWSEPRSCGTPSVPYYQYEQKPLISI